MDVADRAEEIVQIHRAAALDQVAAALAGPGSPDCLDCEDPIEADRRAANPSARRCLACQEARERRQAQQAQPGGRW